MQYCHLLPLTAIESTLRIAKVYVGICYELGYNSVKNGYCGSSQDFKTRWYQHMRTIGTKEIKEIKGYIWKLKSNDPPLAFSLG